MKNAVVGEIYIGGGETEAIKLVAQIAKELRESYPDIRYHLYSGNSDDVTEKLDKGLLDFGILIQPANITKYDYINIPAKDTWGVLMRKDSPLAKQKAIHKEGGKLDIFDKDGSICSMPAAVYPKKYRNEWREEAGLLNKENPQTLRFTVMRKYNNLSYFPTVSRL